jgi:hypothetical protein
MPILKRCVSILARRGLITPIQLDGVDVEVKFTSPLARAQDAEDLMAVQQAVEFVLSTAGPEQVQMAFKIENFGTWAARKTGMASELVRSDIEKQKIIQAGAQAQQQAQQGQQQLPEEGMV